MTEQGRAKAALCDDIQRFVRDWVSAKVDMRIWSRRVREWLAAYDALPLDDSHADYDPVRDATEQGQDLRQHKFHYTNLMGDSEYATFEEVLHQNLELRLQLEERTREAKQAQEHGNEVRRIATSWRERAEKAETKLETPPTRGALRRIQAAEWLGCSPDTLDRLKSSGKIRGFKIGSAVFYSVPELERFVREALSANQEATREE